MSASLPDHLGLIATAPSGIQKLRGLILELAVRGKLVPQDPNDEPASELLKRIAKERERVAAEGICKKSKATPLVDLDPPRFELPDGWEWTTLGHIGETNIGLTYSPANLSTIGTPVLRSSNVQKGLIDLSDLIRVNMHVKDSVLVREGDLLICARNGSKALVGKTALITGLTEEMAFGAFMAIFRSIANPYLLYFINSPLFRRTIDDVNTTTINQITQGNLKATAVPLPPLAEQHRIVAKVDELMALCDRLEAEQTDATSAHAKLVETLLGTLTQSPDAAELASNWQRLSQHFDTLFSTETSLDALKQTILQLAVMGKLVPQDPNDEPASELLKRIAKERGRLEAEGGCKKSKLISPIDDQSLYKLPENWSWQPLGILVRVMDSGWSPACIETPSTTDDVWGVLKTTSVQTFQYLEFENKELPSNLEPRPECEVAVGDILITRAGPKNRVAISCLVESTRPRLMISDKIIRFHLFDGGMYDKFVSLCLNAGGTAEYLESAKSGMAVSQMNITQEKLRVAPIPICPASEQHRIVAKVDELMALCDSLKADLAESRTQQARLSTTLIDAALQAA